MSGREMIFRRVVVPFAMLLLSAFSNGHAGTMPAGLQGSWQVIEVHTNTGATRTTLYGWNDPRLRWRIFSFSDTAIGSDTPESADCAAPAATVAGMGLTKLFGDSLAGYGYPAQQATPEDYAFKVPSGETAQVISVTCQGKRWQGDLGADGGLTGAWMYVAPDRHLMLRWYDETVLVLEHHDTGIKPRASFDCTKAVSPTEKAICQSMQLASFDRSVASAYQQARIQAKQAGDGLNELVSAQKTWMHQRDICAGDATCILKSLKGRLDQLMPANQD
jgi:uncharacterized protein YecT (DUF1311 family)